MTKKIIIKYILSLLLLTNAANSIYATGKINMSSKSNQPFFSIHYQTQGYIYEIRINDVPIDSDKDGGPMATTIPINEWLQAGKNTISLYLKPQPDSNDLIKYGQSCNITTKFLLGQNNEPKNKDAPISIIKYHSIPNSLSSEQSSIKGSSPDGIFDSANNLKADQHGDITISPITIRPIEAKHGQGVIITRVIDIAKFPFPKWKWLTSDKIANNEKTKKELIEQYYNLWSALKNKNIAKYKNSFSERTEEYAATYYQPKEDMNIYDDLAKAEIDPKQELVDFIPKYTVLNVFGDGKLAELTSWDGSTGVIVYNDTDGISHHSYNLIFRKKNNKWIITR